MRASILSRIAELEAAGTAAAVVTVVRTAGSAPRRPGARMLVFPDGRIEGTVGGGVLEQRAIETAAETLEDGRPRYVEHQLTQQLGMCCGGQVALFVECLSVAPPLVVFGAGHVGRALSSMAAHAGFVVHVADEREELLDAARLPEARALHDDLQDPAIPLTPEAFVLVVTHDHALDQRLAERLVSLPHRWLGVIGSRRKATLLKERMRAKGIEASAVDGVRAPVGLAIEAETPEEIAVSILAELIAVRRGADLGAAIPRLETKERPA